MLTDGVESELELLERHIIILRVVIQKGPIGIVKMSEETGIPNHRVRYSLRVLEHESLIIPSTSGALATDEAREYIMDFGSVITRLTEKMNDFKNIEQ
jgi:predicted transcriptional regulator